MKKVLIYNAHLMPMTDAEIACGFLAVEGGKIAALGGDVRLSSAGRL